MYFYSLWLLWIIAIVAFIFIFWCLKPHQYHTRLSRENILPLPPLSTSITSCVFLSWVLNFYFRTVFFFCIFECFYPVIFFFLCFINTIYMYFRFLLPFGTIVFFKIMITSFFFVCFMPFLQDFLQHSLIFFLSSLMGIYLSYIYSSFPLCFLHSDKSFFLPPLCNTHLLESACSFLDSFYTY